MQRQKLITSKRASQRSPAVNRIWLPFQFQFSLLPFAWSCCFHYKRRRRPDVQGRPAAPHTRWQSDNPVVTQQFSFLPLRFKCWQVSSWRKSRVGKCWHFPCLHAPGCVFSYFESLSRSQICFLSIEIQLRLPKCAKTRVLKLKILFCIEIDADQHSSKTLLHHLLPAELEWVFPSIEREVSLILEEFLPFDAFRH